MIVWFSVFSLPFSPNCVVVHRHSELEGSAEVTHMESKFNPDWLTGIFTAVLAVTGVRVH